MLYTWELVELVCCAANLEREKVDLTTRIDLLDRVSFEDLNSRWASDPTLPKGLALKKIQEGALRAQFYGYLVESGPGVAERYGNSQHSNGGMREPEWLTLHPKWAYRFLSGSKFAMPHRAEFGYPAHELLEPNTLPAPGENCHFHLVTEARNLFEPGRIEIPTDDILDLEKKLLPLCAPNSSVKSAAEPTLEIRDRELRGNNLLIQNSILQAALRTLVEKIEDGTAGDYVHTSGRHKDGGLNAAKLSKEVDDNRHNFPGLQSTAHDGTAPRGTSLENIQKVISEATNRTVSKKAEKVTPRIKT